MVVEKVMMQDGGSNAGRKVDDSSLVEMEMAAKVIVVGWEMVLVAILPRKLSFIVSIHIYICITALSFQS